MNHKQLSKAWSDWKKNDPQAYLAFKEFNRRLKAKDKSFYNHEITGVIDVNGNIDEFELAQILIDTDEPVPVDQFIEHNY